MGGTPKAVLEQGEEADKQIKALRDRATGAAPQPPAPPATAQAAAGTGTPSPGQPSAPPAGTAAPPGAAAPAPDAGTKTAEQQEIERLTGELTTVKSELRTASGRYGSQVKLLNDQIRDLSGTVTKLLAEKEQLETKLAEAGKANDGKTASPGSGEAGADSRQIVGERFLAEFGNELSGELAQSILRLVKPMKDELAQLRDQRKKDEEAKSADTEKQAQIDAFWRDVEEVAPGARLLNGDPQRNIPADPEFVKFLGSVDPATDMTYRDRAVSAMQSGNTKAVAAVFQAFQKSKTSSIPAPDAPAKPSAAAVSEPAGSRATPPPVDTTKPVFTEAEWNAKWDDLRRRASQEPGNMAAINAAMKELERAYTEGRVRG